MKEGHVRDAEHSNGAPTWRNLFGDFTPEILLVLRNGYGRGDFTADLMAGLTVAILALPLSLAIAIGSGADPAKGLISSVIGGALVSALGGTRFQIGGPAAAFIVIIGGIVSKHGYDGLLLATAMAGIVLIAAALLKLGTYAKYVPGPVILGFTSGLAMIFDPATGSLLLCPSTEHRSWPVTSAAFDDDGKRLLILRTKDGIWGNLTSYQWTESGTKAPESRWNGSIVSSLHLKADHNRAYLLH